MNKYLVELKNIKKIYRHRNGIIEIFKKLNLNIKPGELIALVGPSGSGKSTLLHILALLDTPTGGKVSFLGQNVKTFDENKKNEIRKRKISIIFQDNNLLADFSTLENVAMPLIIRGQDEKTSYLRSREILKAVKLENRLSHFPSELSGGEQQRVAIARALVAETDLILADEPTGNLDFKTSEEIFSYFLRFKKMKKAVVFATHNRELAKKADYILNISNGIIKRLNGKLK
jgi:ABC-type lipoprotein export system ATPase subunit|tara:strand:- start:1556 stop:2248 length:693 start_codon:yes stop_codon:yes gene_type:complete